MSEEKKRKRLSEAGGPSKKKKVAFENQSGTAKVKHMSRDEDWLPVVGMMALRLDV